ncbi:MULTISPECIES: hypothetical protein [unclassified Methylobacterium]|uniref:hypothetical protein n=1 Tax=unclassified Methylobacterium TaxID=2615210 RepID=UPI003702BF2B
MESDVVGTHAGAVPLGIGYYTVPEAARLLRVPARNINRWLGGYATRSGDGETRQPPLWEPELPRAGMRIEMGFRDLIELRFVAAFLAAGLGLRTIRSCLDHARACVEDDRPFSTRRFRTDGRTIFLDSLRRSGESELLDLKKHQFAFKSIVEQTFRDLDIEADAVSRWRPYHGKPSIVVDPQRAFGQPVATESGVPTVALAEAVKAEGSMERVAYLYEVPVPVVRDAVKFEASLKAA